MSYQLLITIHIYTAILFIGVVFFEVIFLESIRKKFPNDTMSLFQKAITDRARKFMPFVLVALFLSGSGMAYHHFPNLNTLTTSSFGILLSLKALLAFSVLIHFITAMYLSKKGKLTCDRFKYTHLSVFCHMILIIFLAKNMFYLTW